MFASKTINLNSWQDPNVVVWAFVKKFSKIFSPKFFSLINLFMNGSLKWLPGKILLSTCLFASPSEKNLLSEVLSPFSLSHSLCNTNPLSHTFSCLLSLPLRHILLNSLSHSRNICQTLTRTHSSFSLTRFFLVFSTNCFLFQSLRPLKNTFYTFLSSRVQKTAFKDFFLTDNSS